MGIATSMRLEIPDLKATHWLFVVLGVVFLYQALMSKAYMWSSIMLYGVALFVVGVLFIYLFDWAEEPREFPTVPVTSSGVFRAVGIAFVFYVALNFGFGSAFYALEYLAEYLGIGLYEMHAILFLFSWLIVIFCIYVAYNELKEWELSRRGKLIDQVADIKAEHQAEGEEVGELHRG